MSMILGYLTQTFLVRRYGKKHVNEQIKPVFPSFATLGVPGIIFLAITLKPKAIINSPHTILNMIVPRLLFYAINFVADSAVGKSFIVRDNAIALVYGSVMRNLSVALAISMVAVGDAGTEMALIIAVAYISQVQTAA